MSKVERNGERKRRDIRRNPRLGYYIIITDTKETEKNYFEGLKKSFPIDLQQHIVIQVKKTSTKDLIKTCIEEVSSDPQYRQPWIIFDRDQVSDFDEIIETAQNNKINVGWSNPCIEIWFEAYFGKMNSYLDSVKCCEGFSKKYSRVLHQKYEKSDVDIYDKLNRYGNEKEAIKRSKERLISHRNNGKIKPSEMCPCSTLHIIVEEITNKKNI